MNFTSPQADKAHKTEINYCSFQFKVYPRVNLKVSS